MSDQLRIFRSTGAALERFIPALAQLRITVFRDFPYLYDGNMDYEQRYLRTYVEAPGSVMVLVVDGDDIVGASTAVPLEYETNEIKLPFVQAGVDPRRVFYLGESVLRENYRGRGLGVRFFREREAHAREIGQFEHVAFCAVDRPSDHPRRPAGYTPLDAFWRKRGYEKQSQLRTTMTWRDLDEATPTPKPMTFWLKRLS